MSHRPPRTARSSIAVLLLALATSSALGGCGDGSTASAQSSSDGSASRSAAGSASPSPSSSPSSPSAAATSSPSGSPTTRRAPVPAPGGGNVSRTVAPSPVRTTGPLALDAVARVGEDVEVRLTSVKPGTATAQGPGEIAGPALFLTVELRNGSTRPLNSSAAFVSLVDSDGQASVPLTTDPYRPLPPSVAPGKRAGATFVFRVADSARDPIRFSFTYSATAPTVIFVGSAK